MRDCTFALIFKAFGFNSHSLSGFKPCKIKEEVYKIKVMVSNKMLQI